MLLAALAAGCVDELPSIEGTTSLRVELVTPDDPGAVDDRLDAEQRMVMLKVTALDVNGDVDTGFSKAVDVYAHFLGSLSPALSEGEPLTRVRLDQGIIGNARVDLPPVYGPTFLWIEDGGGETPSFSTGTSETLWYRDPYLADISRPEDETRFSALERSPLEQKQVDVTESRYGSRGRLVVTGIYSQGFTLADVECADSSGRPPCTTGDYDSIYVFTFNRAKDVEGNTIEIGDTVDHITGSIGEFNGLTEVNFPRSWLRDGAPDTDRLPEPVVIQESWLNTKIEMERVESGLVAVEGATMCPLDIDWDEYSQWKLDVGLGCFDSINVISKGLVPDFDPTQHEGKVIGRVVGTLRPVNGGDFNVWIVYPRFSSDVSLTTP